MEKWEGKRIQAIQVQSINFKAHISSVFSVHISWSLYSQFHFTSFSNIYLGPHTTSRRTIEYFIFKAIKIKLCNFALTIRREHFLAKPITIYYSILTHIYIFGALIKSFKNLFGLENKIISLAILSKTL